MKYHHCSVYMTGAALTHQPRESKQAARGDEDRRAAAVAAAESSRRSSAVPKPQRARWTSRQLLALTYIRALSPLCVMPRITRLSCQRRTVYDSGGLAVCLFLVSFFQSGDKTVWTMAVHLRFFRAIGRSPFFRATGF